MRLCADRGFPMVLEMPYPGPYGDLVCYDCGTGTADDFGDVPDTGSGTRPGNDQTTELDSGPHHTITPLLYLGERVDAESDGQPNTGANGDDTNPVNPDDEDVSDSTISIAANANVDVTVVAMAGWARWQTTW